MGWDMFDCVIPTREGRHGRLFVWKRKLNLELNLNKKQKFYETVNINNRKYKTDFEPVEKNCDCELCRNYSRSYLHYLFAKKEPLALRLATLHNLRFYAQLMEKIRRR